MKKDIESTHKMEDLADYLEAAFLCGFADLFLDLQEKFIRIYSLSDSVISLLECLRTLTFVDQYGDIRYENKPDLSGLIDRIGARAAYLLPEAISQLTSKEDLLLRDQLNHLHFILTHPFYPSLRQYFSDTWILILTRNDHTDYYHGKALKYAIDQKLIGESFTDQQFIRHLSAAEPDKTLEWLKGLLSHHILWIVFDRNFLWRLNKWLGDMNDEFFQINLPVLRKIFSQGRSEDRRLLFESIIEHPTEEKINSSEKGDLFIKHAEEVFFHFFPDKRQGQIN